NHLICTWLELPNTDWPPDHYTLLGLAPCETDLARIEMSVHERTERVRRYQLTHEALVTEAMNRLAQAFNCLTDPIAKQAYDQANFPHLAPPPSRVAVVETKAIVVQGSAALLEPPPIRGAGQAQGNWATMPPPPRSRSEHDTVIEALEAATALNETLPLFPALTAAPAEPAPSQPVDPI